MEESGGKSCSVFADTAQIDPALARSVAAEMSNAGQLQASGKGSGAGEGASGIQEGAADANGNAGGEGAAQSSSIPAVLSTAFGFSSMRRVQVMSMLLTRVVHALCDAKATVPISEKTHPWLPCQ